MNVLIELMNDPATAATLSTYLLVLVGSFAAWVRP